MKQALVIDDSEFIRRTVARVLEKAGFETHSAADGIAALALLDSLSPDVIVCDFNMPEMDGLTFLGRLREIDRFVELPIVMLSTETRTVVQSAAELQGALWMSKPFKPDQLLQVIDVAMKAAGAAPGGESS